MDTLTIDLFDPGMSPLHRAGLGGLACTLSQLEWPEAEWEIDDEGRRLTLKWPRGPEGARPFFEKLYSRAFDIRNGMIHLPGAYGSSPMPPWIKAELQRGMASTILQFAPNRKTQEKGLRTVSYEVDSAIVVQYQYLVDYTHRGVPRGKEFIDSKGRLKEAVSIPGTLAPGFVQRHVAHGSTFVEQPPGHAIALHFALVGTISLEIGRSKGVLIVPEVSNLHDFIDYRPSLNPQSAFDCQITSPADAALQAQVRLRATEVGLSANAERCLAIMFSSTMWNSKQKARTAVLEVAPLASELDRYAEVMSFKSLQPRIVEAKPEKKGDPPRKFWAGGLVRSLIAENIVAHRKWFTNFRNLVVGPDGKADEQRVRQLSYEREGLHQMIERPWEDKGEETLVRSIHQAMNQCFGKMWEDSGKDPTTHKNRRKRQMERWRLAFAHAKTSDDVRAGLSDIWARAGQVRALMDAWRELLPIFCDDRRWALNRDLALLALASYESPWKEGDDTNPEGNDIPS
jgi:CRISPR-associated protein Cas8a1/Csx13